MSGSVPDHPPPQGDPSGEAPWETAGEPAAAPPPEPVPDAPPDPPPPPPPHTPPPRAQDPDITFWDLSLVVAAVVALGILISIVGALVGLAVKAGHLAGLKAALEADETLASSLFYLVEFALLMGPVWLMVLRRRAWTWRHLGLGSLTGRMVLGGIGLGLLVKFGFGVPYVVLLESFSGTADQVDAFERMMTDTVAPGGLSGWGFAVMVLSVGLLAPLAEEVIFRALLFRWLRRHLGFWGGALISATLFGLAHGVNVVWTVNAAALGLAAAWAYHRSGSLWPAAVAHMAYNLVAVAAIHGAVSAG